MIDLHCHSICSDGSDRPEDLPALADRLGLRALALTDHDTLDGLDSFLEQQSNVSTRLIPGIEFSCQFSGYDLHILGLFINHRDEIFLQRVQSLKSRRHIRNTQIFQKLEGQEINICPEDFFDQEEQELITRAHIADMLLKTGHVTSKAEAFHKYLGDAGTAYVPLEFLSPETAFMWIREAGGLPFIAHPGRYSTGRFVWDRAMADLRDVGACGIEVYHSEHSDAETAYFLRLCQTLNMLVCGGSDYHGLRKSGCRLGTGWGGLCVPDWVLDELQPVSEFTHFLH